MEDLFFLTKRQVPMDVVRATAHSLGYVDIQGSEDAFNIVHENSSYWGWLRLRSELGEWDVFDERDKAKIRELGVADIYVISHHVNSLPSLLALLRAIMNKIEGWVAPDGSFDTVYGADRVLEFVYPNLE